MSHRRQSFWYILSLPLLLSKKASDQARQSAELISGRRLPSIIGGADGPRPQTLDGGSRRVLDRLSAFLSENIGSALKGGVKVCQRQLVNEVLGLPVTEFALNFGRKDATPLQRAFQCGPLSHIQAAKLIRYGASPDIAERPPHSVGRRGQARIARIIGGGWGLPASAATGKPH